MLDSTLESYIVDYLKGNISDCVIEQTPETNLSMYVRNFNNAAIYVAYQGTVEYIYNVPPDRQFVVNRTIKRRARVKITIGTKSYRRTNYGLLYMIDKIRNLLTNYQPSTECFNMIPISDIADSEMTEDGNFWGEVVFEVII